MSAATQYATTGEVNWGHVGVAALAGGVAGAFTGGVGGKMVGAAAGSGDAQARKAWKLLNDSRFCK
jgi:hypothetical protein